MGAGVSSYRLWPIGMENVTDRWCGGTFVLEIPKPSCLCSSSFPLDSKSAGQREFSFSRDNSKGQGGYRWKSVAQACCPQFQLFTDEFLGFRINWSPPFLDFTCVPFLVASPPCSPLSYFSNRLGFLWDRGCCFLFCLCDCVHCKGWTHSR